MWYKKIADRLFKANEVHSANFQIDESSDKSKEINGWKWFETEDQAYAHFGLTKPEEEDTSKANKRNKKRN